MFGAFKAHSLIGRFDRGWLGLTPIIGIILH
jgi:hypothetical protein